MKKRDKKLNKVTKIFAMILLATVFAMPVTGYASTITELQKKQAAAAAAAASAKKAAEQKAAQAASLNVQINNLSGQIQSTEQAITQAEQDIASTQTVLDDLSKQITDKQDSLDIQKKKLDDVVTSFYMEGDNSGLAFALLSSDTLSGAITKQEYFESIKQQIQDQTAKLTALKVELEAKKAEQNDKMIGLQKLKDQKQNYYNTATSQKNYKDRLLTGTIADKQAYLDQADALQAQVHSISDQIYALRVQLQKSHAGEGLISGGNGGYPYTAIDAPDPWMFLTRECVSYTAWYWNVMLGKEFVNSSPPHGNATDWPELGANQGYSVSSTPRVNAIISWRASGAFPYGHVAIVEKVNSDGTIDVSEYNWVRYAYSYRSNVNPASYGSFSYIY